MSKSYTQVSKGSSGDSVLQLQKLLNQNGYKLAEDGVFGNKTLSAVQDYQKSNGLSVDGIVGNKTWGALKGGLTDANPSVSNKLDDGSGSSSSTNKTTGFTYDDYTASDTVNQALAAIDGQLAAKPGAYEGQWQTQVNDIIDRILNREDFSYDVNGDALYQQYKDQYTALGKLAMQDTMGQASAMTGGYGNSYASTAGNQAYQSYLSQVNEVVPELYAMALDQYNQEGQELYNQYGMLAEQDSQEYARYQDSYNQWLSELGLLYDQYNNERAFDYGIYSDNKSYAYDEHNNAIANEQWQQEFDAEQDYIDWQKEQHEKETEGSTYSYSGTTTGGNGKQVSYNNGSLSNAQVKQLQAALGVKADGYYGPSSKEAAGGLSAAEAYAKYVGASPTGSQGATTSNITSAMESKAAEFESNDALANWAYGLADAGTITEDEADKLISTYMDPNEKYADKGDGTKAISYSEMAKSTSGWTVVDNGGFNWPWGVDNNAIVKAPNDEQIRLDNLIDKLVNEGMSKSDAKSYVKKLQENLNI